MTSSRLKGFSLIEALVALVILSIGVLGLAAMQLKALQGATIAYQRSLASLIALDGEERVWQLLAEHDDSTSWDCPTDISTQEAAWLSHWSGALDFINSTSGDDLSTVMRYDGSLGDCSYMVDVTWRDISKPFECDPADEDCVETVSSDHLVYVFRIPGVEADEEAAE